MNDRGAAGLAMLGVVALLVIGSVLVVDLGRFLAAWAQTSTAADAAALAAAPVTFRPYGASGSPAAEAARFAIANGARLEACACGRDPSFWPREVEVVVTRTIDLTLLGRRTLRMSSRAEFDPVAAVLGR